jgi:hypothetical protein
MYTTTRDSYDCECGGRTCNIPTVLSRHQETKKHKDWTQWKELCCRLMVETSHKEKRKLLRELKVLAPIVA